MKKILFLIFVIPVFLLAQEKKQDLYIAYENCNIYKDLEIHNDTIAFQIYRIKFGDKANPEIKYSVNEDGFLVSQIRMSGKTYPILSLTYKNENGNNPTITIDQNQIKNKIWAKHIVYARETDFSTFFDNFENIYLVDFNNKEEESKTAKKVTVIFHPTL